MNDASLLKKAKAGLLTRDEIADVANALLSEDPGRDTYTLIHILGRSGAVEHESLVASYLENRADPIVARIALQVLCLHWNKAGAYQAQVERFVRGVQWDPNEEVRLAAISIAGELLRSKPDATLLRLLVALFMNTEQAQLVRQAAYFALARASGRDWDDLPPATRVLDLESEADPRIVAWATEKARTLPALRGAQP